MSDDESVWDRRGIKPESVIISTPEEIEIPLPNTPQQLQDTPFLQYNENINPQTRRLELATIVFAISMFLYWGYVYWQVWYLELLSVEYFYYDGYRPSNGFSEMMLTLEYFFGGMGLFDHYSWILQEAGILVFLVLIMRDFMPMVFIGIFIACWLNKTKAPSFYEKISIFGTVYFLIMSGVLLYSVVHQMLYVEYADDAIFDVFFDTIGFWLSGIAIVLIHPKIIPLSDNLTSRPQSFFPTVRKRSEQVTGIPIMDEADTNLNLGKFALFYLPLVFLLITTLSVMDGGDDDAFCVGIGIPIVGFFAGIGVYKLEFLKGFGAHLAYSIGYAFVGYLLVLIGFFNDGEEGFLGLLIMASLTMPIVLHLKQNHVRALGSAYAAPLCMFIMLIGLIIGMVQTDGLF
jgi:hypothetical protein